MDAAKIMVVTNGLNFQKRPLSAKAPDKFRIIEVGEVKPRKGQDHLLETAKILKDRYKLDFQVEIIGKYNHDDPYVKHLFDLIEQYDLKGQVELKGQVSQAELDAAYQASSLFVLLSVNENGHYEGYPLSFHEAAMWGLPVLGSWPVAS